MVKFLAPPPKKKNNNNNNVFLENFSKYWWFQTKQFTRLLEFIKLYKQILNTLEKLFYFHFLPRLHFGFNKIMLKTKQKQNWHQLTASCGRLYRAIWSCLEAPPCNSCTPYAGNEGRLHPSWRWVRAAPDIGRKPSCCRWQHPRCRPLQPTFS